jgi:hypothetical protein
MTFTFASDFMLGAVASLILPTGVFICLAIWLTRASRRVSSPVSQPPAATRRVTPEQMSAQTATTPPAQAPPAAQTPPAETPPDTPDPGVQ